MGLRGPKALWYTSWAGFSHALLLVTGKIVLFGCDDGQDQHFPVPTSRRVPGNFSEQLVAPVKIAGSSAYASDGPQAAKKLIVNNVISIANQLIGGRLV